MTSSHGPIQAEQLLKMQAIAEVLDKTFNGPALINVNGKKIERPKTWGFTLLVFEFGSPEDGRMNYISNAEREDMLTAMKEFIANAEGRLHTTETKQ